MARVCCAHLNRLAYLFILSACEPFEPFEPSEAHTIILARWLSLSRRLGSRLCGALGPSSPSSSSRPPESLERAAGPAGQPVNQASRLMDLEARAPKVERASSKGERRVGSSCSAPRDHPVAWPAPRSLGPASACQALHLAPISALEWPPSGSAQLIGLSVRIIMLAVYSCVCQSVGGLRPCEYQCVCVLQSRVASRVSIQST